MEKKKIVEVPVNNLSPLVYNGLPVYNRYSQIREVLRVLGDMYAELLCEPHKIGDKYFWNSSYVQNPVSIESMSPDRQAQSKANLKIILNKISGFCQQLRTDGQQEYANFIEMAVTVPGYEYVFVDGDRMVLAAWGFSSNNISKRNTVDILSETIPVAPRVAPEAYSAPSNPPENPPSTPAAPVETNNVEPVAEQKVAAPPSAPVPPVESAPAQDSGNSGKKRFPGWLWFILGVILTLLVVFLLRSCGNNGNDCSCTHDCDGGCDCGCAKVADNSNRHGSPDGGNHDGNPSNPGGGNDYYEEPGDPFFDTLRRVPPVDTTKIIHDPDEPGERPILSNTVNLALDKGIDVKQFVIDVQDKFPGNVEVVFADTVIKLLQVQVPEGKWKDWMDTLKALDEVRLAFPTSLFQSGRTPSDPGFKDNKKGWYFNDIQALSAWDITMGDSSVIVAVADNGFELDHPELSGKIYRPYNVTTGNADVHVIRAEGNMHGTHVAGTAVGNAGNQGVCGIAPNCKLMPIQVADDNGMMTNISIMAAALYAIHHGASVVNFSLGAYFGELSPAEQDQLMTQYGQAEAEFWNELYDFANDENCVMVLAAGNENILAGCDPFSRSSKVLVVSAYQQNASHPKADFSNFGKYSNISAPGVEIYSSVPGGKYDFLQGTSMAAPVVAGAVGLIKSRFPFLTAEELVSIIKKTAKPLQSRPAIGPLIQIETALKQVDGYKMLEVPDNVTNPLFLIGDWCSLKDFNVEGDGTMEIIFHVKADLSGTIEYKEASGNSYTAPFSAKLKDNSKLVVTQKGKATGSGSGQYDECVFVLERDGYGMGLCHAQFPDGSPSSHFHLRKVK